MKYLLSILCLFIFSCDNGNDDYDAIFMLGENFTMPMNQNTTWSYNFTEGSYIETENDTEYTFLIEGTLNRMVIDNIDAEYDTDSNCTYIIEENISSDIIINPSDGFEYNFDENIPEMIFKPFVEYDGFYYSFYSDNTDSFESCGSFSQTSEEEEQSESNEYTSIPSPILLLNILRLEYPLYLGKSWTPPPHEILGSIQYEIVSQENIILDINGSLTLFECYKIVVDYYAGITAEYYLSSQGIIKAKLISDALASLVSPEYTGEEIWYLERELILTDF